MGKKCPKFDEKGPKIGHFCGLKFPKNVQILMKKAHIFWTFRPKIAQNSFIFDEKCPKCLAQIDTLDIMLSKMAQVDSILDKMLS